MKEKKYKCTSKIKYKFIKKIALRNMAEYYISQDNHNRAREMFIESALADTKAWACVFELYPKLKGLDCVYYKISNHVERVK